MKATEQYFYVVLSIILYKVVLTFETENEILTCDDSNESYGAYLSWFATFCKIIYNVQHTVFPANRK